VKAGFWSWIRGQQGTGESVPPQAAPTLEPLEPRILLNADMLGIEPLRTLDVQSCEQVIQVDLNHQSETTDQSDSSLILSYLASAQESQEAVAGQDEQGQDEGAVVDSLAVLGGSVVDESTPCESLGQAGGGSEIIADSSEPAALFVRRFRLPDPCGSAGRYIECGRVSDRGPRPSGGVL
jgi:hypothetical protein